MACSSFQNRSDHHYHLHERIAPLLLLSSDGANTRQTGGRACRETINIGHMRFGTRLRAVRTARRHVKDAGGQVIAVKALELEAPIVGRQWEHRVALTSKKRLGKKQSMWKMSVISGSRLRVLAPWHTS